MAYILIDDATPTTGWGRRTVSTVWPTTGRCGKPLTTRWPSHAEVSTASRRACGADTGIVENRRNVGCLCASQYQPLVDFRESYMYI